MKNCDAKTKRIHDALWALHMAVCSRDASGIYRAEIDAIRAAVIDHPLDAPASNPNAGVVQAFPNGRWS